MNFKSFKNEIYPTQNAKQETICKCRLKPEAEIRDHEQTFLHHIQQIQSKLCVCSIYISLEQKLFTNHFYNKMGFNFLLTNFCEQGLQTSSINIKVNWITSKPPTLQIFAKLINSYQLKRANNLAMRQNKCPNILMQKSISIFCNKQIFKPINGSLI